MSDSVRPHRRQPTRLPRPWDSPGKNTGVGCHFLCQCMKVKSGSEVAQSCLTLCDPVDCSLPGSSAHGIFQARVLEWGAIAFSFKCFSSALFVIPWSKDFCFRNSLTWCFHKKKKIFEEGQGSAVVCEPRSTDLTFSFLLVLPRVEEIN